MSSSLSRILCSAIYFCGLLFPVFSQPSEPADYAVKVILFPFREAVLSSEVDSTVLSFEKNEGETFQENDILVKLDPSLYENQLRRAKASLEEAEATYNYSRENYDILKKMIEGNMASDADVSQAELEIKVAASKHSYQQAMYDMAVKQQELCTLHAPFSGRMIKKEAQPYEFVRIGQRLVTIIDDSALLGVMPLPSARKKDIRIGDNVDILVEETGTVITGKIHEIAGQIDFVSKTFEVKVIIDNSDHNLIAGMSGILQAIRPADTGNQENAQ